MCAASEGDHAGRRDFLKIGLTGLALAATTGVPGPARAAGGEATTLSPDQALAALKSGNSRYVSNPQQCSIDLAKQRATLTAHQAPWATIIGCADSRVPPELVFGGSSLGELFVARNAGNLADTATLGTVEYGAAVLGSPLIVVLAHTSCGAVKAACDVIDKNATYPGAIGAMIEPILPAALSAKGESGDFIDNAARQSARRTAKRLPASSTVISGLVAQGKVKIVSAIYDLSTGVVTFLE